MKDEGPIGKKMEEAMLAKGKLIVLEKVRLYVPSLAKGGPAKDDLEAKRVEQKSNQSTLSVAAMKTIPAASKPPVVVEKKMSRGFKNH